MKWEYQEIEYCNALDKDWLDQLGQEEWELVTVSSRDRGIIYHFKRPIRLKDDDEITVFVGDAHFQVRAGDLKWKPSYWSE